MTDREQAIKDLEDIIATAEGIKGLSDDAGITISLDKIESLRFALESIKVDKGVEMTNIEELEKAVETMNKIEAPLELQQTVYLGAIAQFLAKIADAIEQKGKEQEKL